MDKIRVLNSYDVIVGTGVISKLTEIVDLRKYSKIFLITTPTVEKYLAQKISDAIPESVEKIVEEVQEPEKNIDTVKKIWEQLRAKNCDRKSLIIILGGGVLGDVAGFAASTYMRGVPFIQIPTTLLSQVDSSVGGKTGINFLGVKNLIGTFVQPIAVICDVDILSTLPDRQFIEGFGEIIKHGILFNREYFDFVTSKKPKEFSKEELVSIVSSSVKIKANIVNEDEKELGKRKLLNFGHTIGHALEALSQSTDKLLLHGEAVSIGMVVEARISQLKDLTTDAVVDLIKTTLVKTDLPTDLPNFKVEDILEKIKADKKSEGSDVKWTLIKNVGEPLIDQSVDEEIIREALG